MAQNNPTKRVWKIGAATVQDEFSMLPFKTSFELLAKQHPQVRHTQVFESDGVAQEDGSILYNIPLVPAKTNG